MIFTRTLRCVAFAVGVLALPLLSWAGLWLCHPARRGQLAGDAPLQVPERLPGPVGMLLEVAPNFAGFIYLWFYLGILLAVALVLWGFFGSIDPKAVRSRTRHILSWGGLGLLLGFVFAFPWFMGIVRAWERTP